MEGQAVSAQAANALPVPLIYRALAGVIADVGAVAKDRVNKTQGFKFRSVDDVYNALHPALAKNKVVIVPEIVDRTCEVIGKTKNGVDMIKVVCTIQFHFFAEDGSSVKAVIVGEGLDTGDKATNKAMAIAYKYACFQVFCIPTEEMVDPDAERPELEEAAKKAPPKGKTGKSAAKAEQAPAGSDQPAQESDQPAARITEAMLHTIRGEMERTGVGEDILKKLYKVDRLEDLDVLQFKAAMNKFKVTPDRKDAGHE